MEKLARSVGKEEKIWVKLIVSAQVVERIAQVASTRFAMPSLFRGSDFLFALHSFNFLLLSIITSST